MKTKRWSIGVGVVAVLVLSLTAGASWARAETEGEAIVGAAQAIQSQSYPQQSFAGAKYLYCFDGGTTTGASPGGTDPQPEGSYSNCNSKGRTGFDCRGLTLYSVYQGTGGAVTLPTATAGAQYSGASSYGGSYIALAALQPGDLVFFGSSSSAIEHVGIVVSGAGTSALIISAINEEDGIASSHAGEPTTIHWFEHGFRWVGAVAIPGVGNTVSGGGPTIATASLPAATVGHNYGATLAATGGTQPYAWQVAGGSLPPGLSLETNGAISGSASESGTFSFEAKVTDGTGASTSTALSIQVEPNLSSVSAVSKGKGDLDAFFLTQQGCLDDAWSTRTASEVGFVTCNVADVAPSAISKGSGDLDAFFVTQQGCLDDARSTKTTSEVGFVTCNVADVAPSAISKGKGDLDTFFVTQQGCLDDAWSNPTSSGINFVTCNVANVAPSAVSKGKGDIDTFFVTQQGCLDDAWWTPTASEIGFVTCNVAG